MPQTTIMKQRLAAGIAATGVLAGGLLGATALSGTASAYPFSPPHTAHKYGPWSQVACHTILIHNQKIAAAHARGDNSSACYSPDSKRYYLYTNVTL